MSFFKSKITKKLKHVQIACKSFIETFRSKLHKKKVHKSIKNIKTFLVSSRHKINIRPLRKRSTTSNHYYLIQKGFPAIYIDELYVPKSGQQSKQPTTSKGKELYVTSTSTSTSGTNHMDKNVATKHDSLIHRKKKGQTRNMAMFDKESCATSTTSTSTSSSAGKVDKKVSTKHDSLLHAKGTSRTRNMAKFETPEFRGVDERAEAFISKVRKDMKLQREQSILDFQEMLARSV
ncbi:hypothetical protein CTI12_AA244700 [Artemisia annua]|uniref:Uncharacterized protein n=1 Tax=Artemisia annua TaxID=35608 RepID=A0A2U1NNX7_ARTAN|nr:hypothetical protein CTI12_AA244700 [Artemisia annua]